MMKDWQERLRRWTEGKPTPAASGYIGAIYIRVPSRTVKEAAPADSETAEKQERE